jgi:peptide-methionine (S)-S-oxide reductase
MRLSLFFALSMLSTSPIIAQDKTEKAVFASGCFWCTESDFEDRNGVLKVVSGYINGQVANPTYQQVSSGSTGHTEAVEITYDPKKTTYKELLKIYWENSDPTVKDRQFCDQGTQYRPGIYFLNAEQEKLARDSKEKVAKFLGVPVLTEIEKAGIFYLAEDYHQDYYKKNPVRYKYYRFNCGRDQRLEKLWKKPGSSEKPGSLQL